MPLLASLGHPSPPHPSLLVPRGRYDEDYFEDTATGLNKSERSHYGLWIAYWSIPLLKFMVSAIFTGLMLFVLFLVLSLSPTGNNGAAFAVGLDSPGTLSPPEWIFWIFYFGKVVEEAGQFFDAGSDYFSDMWNRVDLVLFSCQVDALPSSPQISPPSMSFSHFRWPTPRRSRPLLVPGHRLLPAHHHHRARQ